ncbi:MAG: hypothetical protein HY427_00920 [Candidatus Levybacteria bacterium]|nr:hypothetical protein [Candidatus Levybacteria bacterium]
MVEDGRRSIIGKIEEQRRVKAAHEALVEEAEKAIPAFKDRLGVLIRTHIEPPQERLIDFWESYSHSGRERDGKSYPTILNANVGSAQGIIEANISATSYPSQETGDSSRSNQIGYKVDVQDLDYYLLIEGGKGFLESKERNSDIPVDHANVVIGKRYNSWPAWRRPVDMDELRRYIELLDVLETGDVEFSGSAPVVIKIKPRGLPARRIVDAP